MVGADGQCVAGPSSQNVVVCRCRFNRFLWRRLISEKTPRLPCRRIFFIYQLLLGRARLATNPRRSSFAMDLGPRGQECQSTPRGGLSAGPLQPVHLSAGGWCADISAGCEAQQEERTLNPPEFAEGAVKRVPATARAELSQQHERHEPLGLHGRASQSSDCPDYSSHSGSVA